MKVLAVQPKDFYITVEHSLTELEAQADFIEKVLPLFRKVYQGGEHDELADQIENDNKALKEFIKEIKHGA